ncbi:MAG: hypothetical protein JSR83_09065 [Proteobacteria bacterium]|nr:hypothetical protein [Pseudomonadota bacterium]
MNTWQTVPNKLTPEMRRAAAEAARKYMAETGGNDLDVIWAAALAAAPKVPVKHEFEVIIIDRANTYRARSALTRAAEDAGVNGLHATCTAGPRQALCRLLEKSRRPLDIERAVITAMLPAAGDAPDVSRFNVQVEERSAS